MGVVSVSPLEPQETASIRDRADRAAAIANEVILMLESSVMAKAAIKGAPNG